MAAKDSKQDTFDLPQYGSLIESLTHPDLAVQTAVWGCMSAPNNTEFDDKQ